MNHNVFAITNCSRCEEDHEALHFAAFTVPPKPWTHYAICPITHEPILMRFVKDKPKKRKK